MKKVLLISILLGIALLLPSTGCAKLAKGIELMKPEIRGISHEWGDVTQETTEIITTIRVYNPNPFTLPIKRVTCDLNIDGVEIGHSKSQNLHIEEGAEFPVVISTKIDNSKVPICWAEHLKRHERSEVEMNAGIICDLKVTEFAFPYHFKQPLETDLLSMLREIGSETFEVARPLPFKLSLRLLSSSRGEVTQKQTSLSLSATVHDDSLYPLLIPQIAYDIEMNDMPLVSGETKINYSCFQTRMALSPPTLS